METIKYIEKDKVIAEFTTVQAVADFVYERTKRQCDAEYILSQKNRDSKLKSRFFFIGFLSCEIVIVILGTLHYLKII